MGGTEERELPLGEGGQGQGQVGLGNRQGKEEVVGGGGAQAGGARGPVPAVLLALAGCGQMLPGVGCT